MAFETEFATQIKDGGRVFCAKKNPQKKTRHSHELRKKKKKKKQEEREREREKEGSQKK